MTNQELLDSLMKIVNELSVLTNELTKTSTKAIEVYGLAIDLTRAVVEEFEKEGKSNEIV